MTRFNPAEFPTRQALMEAAADFIADALKGAIRERGAACAALSGGSTPEPAYALLAARDLDWPRVTFALVDERFVPPDHDASNERMLRRALAPALTKGAALAPMYAPARDVEEAAARAEALYAPLKIDVAMMGMGEDGHTASWFADAPNFDTLVDAQNPHTIAALRAPSAAGAAERLTLTFSGLARVDRVGLLITGKAKYDRIGQAYMTATSCPAGRLFLLPAGFPQVFWAE